MKSRIVRWAHLSDFHTGKDNYGEGVIFGRIVEKIKEMHESGFTPDMLFLTGDLVNQGRSSEYNKFWNEFILNIQYSIDNDLDGRMFAVPGNHDIDRNKNRSFSESDFLAKESRHFDPTPEGLNLREIVFPRIQQYVSHDPTNLSNVFHSMEGVYSCVIEARGCRVGIVGTNTAWLCKGDNDRHKLTPGENLIQQGISKIKDAGAEIKFVLGHHPIDWFEDFQSQKITSMFCAENIIYAHGHVHKIWCEPKSIGNGRCLTIQAGAAFQSRETEEWKNTIMFAEADLDKKIIRLQPWQWNNSNRFWSIPTDQIHIDNLHGQWYEFPLPSSVAVMPTRKKSTPTLMPRGWRILTNKDFTIQTESELKQDAIKYFDGSHPSYNLIASNFIACREPYSKVVSFHIAQNKNSCSILVGSTCEGKTTILLQAAFELAKSNNSPILIRESPFADLPASEVLGIISNFESVVIVIDDAEKIIPFVEEFLREASEKLPTRIQILIACREISLSSQKDICFANEKYSIKAFSIDSLTAEEASKIISSWENFGEDGLAGLSSIPESHRVENLMNSATSLAGTKSNHFFGALLSIRHGKKLGEHVKSMLESLERERIYNGKTLLDAYSYIASIHSIGLNILTYDILAHVLDIPITRLHREVIIPLRSEAAISAKSDTIQIRHDMIATVASACLENEFHDRRQDRLVEMIDSAIQLVNQTNDQPFIRDWRYSITEFYRACGQTSTAKEVARFIYSCDPTDSFLATAYCHSLRNNDQDDVACQFMKSAAKVIRNPIRSFYFELAIEFGNLNMQPESAYMALFSLCDAVKYKHDLKGLERAIASLALSMGKVAEINGFNYEAQQLRFHLSKYGLQLPITGTTKSYLLQHQREARENGAVEGQEIIFTELLVRMKILLQNIVDEVELADIVDLSQPMTFKRLEQFAVIQKLNINAA